jgi:hypothetical protein
MSTFSSAAAIAPTTAIHQVTSPTHAIAGSETPLSLSVTIYYNNTLIGYRLVVGVLDASSSPLEIVPGTVVSTSATCANLPAAYALCAMALPDSSGVVRIGFQIGGIFGGRRQPGGWVLNVTSALIDSQNHVLVGSVSSRVFKINLTPVALNVKVPPNVPVTIDGVLQPTGPVSAGVALGEHNVTVPQLINVGQSTRLRFSGWSDGSLSALRMITITNSTTLQADYVTENRLNLIDVQGNTTVSNWYGADGSATFTTNQYSQAPGIMAGIVPRLAFVGWYENGRLLTNSPTGTISMARPHTLTAVWRTDFSEPAQVVLAILTTAVIAFLLVRRRNGKRIDQS